MEILSDTIGLYQGDAQKYFGNEFSLEITPRGEPNAYARIDRSVPRITVTRSLLRELDGDEVLRSVCHEIGHFLGDTSFGGYSDGIAYEGEADYFGGKCMVRYYQEIRGLSARAAESAAIETLSNQIPKRARCRVSADTARESSFKAGINDQYPDWDCRMLTTTNGALGLPRPECWFNP
jgi:hypothetical protein